MNKYNYRFTSVCPNDSEAISYDLEIKSNETIFAEDIVSSCKKHRSSLHEVIADDLKLSLGGSQKIVAYHCGVKITTVR